jgi:hypothetical protein
VSELAPKQKTRSGSQQRKKLHMVTTGYDDAELAQLDEAASRAGLTRASFQRVQTLCTTPKTRSTRRPPIERELLAKTLGELGRIGSNINQIARAANRDKATELDLNATLAELRGLLPDLMQALGRKP